MFDFLNPALEVGVSIPGPGVAAAQGAWPEHLPKFVAALQQLPAGYELVADSGDVARPTRTRDAATVDEAWFTGTMASLTTGAHLRLRRRVDPLQATVQQAREVLLALRADLDGMNDAWWNLVRAVGYLQPDDVAPAGTPA